MKVYTDKQGISHEETIDFELSDKPVIDWINKGLTMTKPKGKIQRWEGREELHVTDGEGQWVLYEDHEQEVERRVREAYLKGVNAAIEEFTYKYYETNEYRAGINGDSDVTDLVNKLRSEAKVLDEVGK